MLRKRSWLMEEIPGCEGDWPFCSWTRLAGVALLIWGDRAKSGEQPGRRRDLAKNTPRYGSKNDKVTRWPKRHNTSQNGQLWSQMPTTLPKCLVRNPPHFSPSGLVIALPWGKSAFPKWPAQAAPQLRPSSLPTSDSAEPPVPG